MAFHFHWSPLIADTDRVRHMLTSALNRSPKPPIIVDDIIVNELNLGQTPPSLEILEIGDLAEDRFRGIFKVKYEGDAYLQLRTKVQANPLNTFLSTKSGFASPDPLAAGSGLTIPLQITLSEIRLSGFVILVFNKQKGITLVFRNDPIESLKVSSTFDTIPFVRNYLQKTIEEQLRVLFVEDLPAIIHRLSLRVFNDDDATERPAEEAEGQDAAEPLEAPTATTEQNLSGGDLSLLSLSPFEGFGDDHTAFSQNNLLRLAALTESQRTLSLFTPSIRDTVFRAWASAQERDERKGGTDTPTYKPSSLSRIQMSHGGGSSTASQASDGASQATRPSLATQASTSTTYSFASGRSSTRTHGARKKKHRVVNLRRNHDGTNDTISDIASVSSEHTESASRSGSISASRSTGPTSPLAGNSHAHSAVGSHRDGEVQTPSTSPKKKVEFQQRQSDDDVVIPLSNEISNSSNTTLRPRNSTSSRHGLPSFITEEDEPTPRASTYLPSHEDMTSVRQEQRAERTSLPRMRTFPDRPPIDYSKVTLTRTGSEVSISDLAPAFNNSGSSSGGILEQAWLTKMATEIARKVAEEKDRNSRSQQSSQMWRRGSEATESDDAPPPAYTS